MNPITTECIDCPAVIILSRFGRPQLRCKKCVIERRRLLDRQGHTRRYNMRLEAGLCVRCGCEPSLAGNTRCHRCAPRARCLPDVPLNAPADRPPWPSHHPLRPTEHEPQPPRPLRRVLDGRGRLLGWSVFDGREIPEATC